MRRAVCQRQLNILLMFSCSLMLWWARSNGASIMNEIPSENLTPCVPHFEVTQGHWNRHWSIGCLWLSVNAPCVIRFARKSAISVENRNFFPTYMYITPPLRSSHWNWIINNTRWPQETRIMELPGWERSVTISLSTQIQYTSVTDRQMDSRRPTASTALTHCVAQ